MTALDENNDEGSDGPGPFGVWLRAAREKAGRTQGWLAEQSGVSGQQISNIEIGRTRNPQESTRTKLEKALSMQAPPETVQEETESQTIPGLGTLVGFDPHEQDSLPRCHGVYVLYDKTARPVYVGRATKRHISVRIPEHYEKFWFRRPVIDSGRYIEIPGEELCARTETLLIKVLDRHLLLNRQGVSSEEDEVG
jgi:transcriptional regulator with XRE-family HTH domain